MNMFSPVGFLRESISLLEILFFFFQGAKSQVAKGRKSNQPGKVPFVSVGPKPIDRI